MLVSACSSEYLLLMRIWLRSVTTTGGVEPKNICIIAYGQRDECMAIERDLKRDFVGLVTVACDLANEEFDFLSPMMKYDNRACVADYLRAWIGTRIPRYVWMDCDILLRGSLAALIKMLEKAKTLYLARELRNELVISPNFYLVCSSELGEGYYELDGEPVIVNCGVIVVDRSYALEWKERFLKLLAVSPEFAVSMSQKSDMGQIVWNNVFWSCGGKLLPKKYNTFVDEPTGGATVVHYARRNKATMFRHAVERGFA